MFAEPGTTYRIDANFAVDRCFDLVDLGESLVPVMGSVHDSMVLVYLRPRRGQKR
jgi:hypothetical protein